MRIFEDQNVAPLPLQRDDRFYTLLSPLPIMTKYPSTTTTFLCPKDTSVQKADTFNRKCKHITNL